MKTITTQTKNKMQTVGRRWSAIFLAVCLLVSSIGEARAEDSAEHALHVDIPNTLEKADVVIDYGHAAFNSDLPFALADIGFLAADFHDWNTKGQIIVIFHGDAAYIALTDDAYNANRHVKTGNPYKQLVNALMGMGVQFEMCGATAKGNHWGNADLLPGFKVTVNAMVRLTQLQEQGYTMIYQ